MVPVWKKIQVHPLIDKSKIFLSAFDIHLDVTKHFVKQLKRDCDYFTYFCTNFSGSTTEKLKAGF